jgi:proteasome lid subunit RPN8/RPN11
MRAHARDAFPEECCGFLIGHADRRRRVLEARRARNVATEDRARRYLVDPLELLHADDDARKRGLDLVGIYHSHPNHPAEPSEFDRSHASPWYSYVIVGVVDGEPRTITAWRFNESTKEFEPETIVGPSEKARTRKPSRARKN